MLLNNEEILERLNKFPFWSYKNNSLVFNGKFTNFVETLSKVNLIGEVAEKLNHHPDLYIYSYNNLEITVASHDVGGVTEKDFELLKLIEEIGE